jgi:hypothetical protein
MEKNGIPIGSVKDTKPKSEGTVLKGWWATVLNPEDIDAPDKNRTYVDYTKPSTEKRSPIDITKKDEKLIRLAVEKYLKDNSQVYPVSSMFLPDGTEIDYNDFVKNISKEKGVYYIFNPATGKKERMKETWIDKEDDLTDNSTADKFFRVKKQAVQHAIDAVWGKIMYRANKNSKNPKDWREGPDPTPAKTGPPTGQLNADSNGLEFYYDGDSRVYTGLQDKNPVNPEALKKNMYRLMMEAVPTMGGEPKNYVNRTIHPELWLDPEKLKKAHPNTVHFERYANYKRHNWEWNLIKSRTGGIDVNWY